VCRWRKSIVAGTPPGTAGSTNTLRVHKLGESMDGTGLVLENTQSDGHSEDQRATSWSRTPIRRIRGRVDKSRPTSSAQPRSDPGGVDPPRWIRWLGSCEYRCGHGPAPLEDAVEEPTFYLFAKPSWRSGAARVLDLFGMFDDTNLSEDPEQADAIALYLDFRAFGLDLVDASRTPMQRHEQEKA
jgi:hypothetical protein